MNSLKRKLFLILIATTSLIWLAATYWIYVGTTREVENVLDARLQQAARMVLSLASNGGIGAAQRDSDSGLAPEILSYQRQLSCQIWSLDGRLVARSSGAPDERLSDKETGFSERLINGETWRVFTAEDASKGLRVLVGDHIGLRQHFVAEIITDVLAPMAVTVPLLGLLIWASLNRGLRPLRMLAQELARRSPDDMSPVATGAIPAEIRAVVGSLNTLFAKVAEAMRHERDITAFAAHELRTPLAGLRTQAQIAMATSDDATRQTALGQIIVAVDRIVRQLLAVAKLDSSSEPIQPKAVNVGEVIREVIVALPASDRAVGVAIDPALHATTISADRDTSTLAVRNLHENAVRHSKQDGEIRWSLENSGESLRVYVEDGGPGIPDDEIPLVTNRFFRGRNKSPIDSGLGLSIVELALKVNRARLVLRNRTGSQACEPRSCSAAAPRAG